VIQCSEQKSRRRIARAAIGLAVIYAVGTGSAQAGAFGSVYDMAGAALTTQQNDACGQGVTAAAAAGKGFLQNAGNNVQNGIGQPGNLNQESCIATILGQMKSAYSTLTGLFGGGGSLLGSLEKFGSSLLQSAGNEAISAFCGVANSQWNNASSQIDSITSLPSSVGQSITYGAGSIISSPINNASGALSGATDSLTSPITGGVNNATGAATNSAQNLLGNLF
jgi:hypothetical protein